MKIGTGPILGHKHSDWTMTNVSRKKAILVVITDWELKNF